MVDSKVKDHHVRQELCTNRPAYREGRQLKAVKVYTVAQESRYLLVQKVPSVGAMDELIKLFALYGTIEEYRVLDEYPAEEFTEVYVVKYQRIQSARLAKRKLDDYNFYGGSLHVCYAPEHETIDDTRQKLVERRKEVAKRIHVLASETSTSSLPQSNNESSAPNDNHARQTKAQHTTCQRESVDPVYNISADDVPAPLQGPMLPDEVETKRKNFQSSETGDRSYDSTVNDVRKAVSAFSTSLLPRTLKKLKKC